MDSHKARLNHAHCSVPAGAGWGRGGSGAGRVQNGIIIARLRTDLRLSQVVPKVRFSWILHPIWPLGTPPSDPAVGMSKGEKINHLYHHGH